MVSEPASKIVVYAPDLMMRQQIVTGLTAAGYPATGAATASRYHGALAGERPTVIVIELDGPGVDAIPALQRLAADPATADIPVIGFCAHTRVELITAARAAGARVASRGEITRKLPQIVAEVLAAV